MPLSRRVTRAFVLGAGLGTRLRPLTLQLPKPLIPVHHRPLMEYAFAHLHSAGVKEFIVNTHHLPEEYPRAFPGNEWRGCPLTFRHEPVLLETGGGLANIQDLLRNDEPFFVYNGDVFTDLPLAPAIEQHRAGGNLVTLVLRTSGPVRNVGLDQSDGRIVDIRNARGINHPDQFQFTGLYIVEPGFFRYLPAPGAIESVVMSWLRALEAGERLGGVVVDDGLWLDLGDRGSYLQAHRLISPTEPRIHPSARIEAGADIDDHCSIGPRCVVENDAVLRASILWPTARVCAGARLAHCVVMSGHTAAGEMDNADI
ncbi:MAG TPA: sugar phosphate nucleotidyltransferase [Verrucomicrobiales bacterium]|nr:sugar phosphate nucleotidyltransferase [Verrucomicrobiales bacterium]